MINAERMLRYAGEYGVTISDSQLQSLDEYAEFLVAYNQKVNLTAITRPEEIEIKHFLDCLLLAKQPEACGAMADVGSGAGFPGVILKLYAPAENRVTLFEPTGKRVQFLKELAQRLQLDIAVEKERAEEAGRKAWRGQFNFVTARAVAQLSILSEYCLPLLKVGGHFIAMKGSETQELDAAQTAIEKLGGKYLENRRYILPDGATRHLVVVQKVADTTNKYPRNGGVIAKRPL